MRPFSAQGARTHHHAVSGAGSADWEQCRVRQRRVPFPIFNFLDLGFAPLGLPPVHGTVFFDVGTAFNAFDQLAWSRGPGADPYDVRTPLAAYGAGLRINILYTVLRIDYSVPVHRPNRRGGVWSLSFGPTF